MKPRVTIRDVAETAGVSITTVSHVLNGKGRASEATKRIVLEAAERVGYNADPIARSLRTGQTRVIGIVFRPSDAISGSMHGTEYHIRLAGSAATAALSQGYGLLHLPRLEERDNPVFPMDGCIVVAPHRNDPAVTSLIRQRTPYVLADADPGRPELEWCLRRDDYGGMQGLLDHMADHGAQQIAFYSGTDENMWLIEAARGYRDWCEKRQLKPRLARLPESAGPDRAHDQALADLSLTSDKPDAIVAATSRFAYGVGEAARKLGLEIPGDLMVAALSDSDIARDYPVPITALDLHGETVGRESVQMLMTRLANDSLEVRQPILPTLRIRQSTNRRY
ncbi:LacI family DNA-binding transcriptional regulator [Bradyrhizobium sp. LHD-71]|uniref:LacI family DNA-binding transcriptional regulator n=1 Tax=Bradyrhizobium sp. LHD-71 TaxID=3072141 RepID=UPI00280DFC08|nr:LacI family DNA-binding transcriptional regulator [Bradyrhizobium sp. LHD-71]MDQ8730865.1 LacI family DNA-binding transcriptional regulator [Bradyrhizobium sp. LHD-71]